METGFRKWIITITVIISAIIELIDTTIVNVSINTMSGNLAASLEDTAWVITSYAIANVIVIPMTSFLAEKIGRKQYYIGSIILFTVASALCGLSNNLWELVAFRFLQGLGGGALLSTSQAILFETFPPKDRALASGIFALGVIIGPSIGPVMGGYIVDNASWPWIFFVNVPIGLLAMLLCIRYLRPTQRSREGKPIDWLGIGLLSAGIGSLQVVLERGETDDWFSANYIIVSVRHFCSQPDLFRLVGAADKIPCCQSSGAEERYAFHFGDNDLCSWVRAVQRDLCFPPVCPAYPWLYGLSDGSDDHAGRAAWSGYLSLPGQNDAERVSGRNTWSFLGLG